MTQEDPNLPILDLPLSPRSRRLRTVGALLMLAILGMIAFGWFYFQPKLSHAVHANSHIVHDLRYPPILREHARKVALTQLMFGIYYWAFCFLLVLGLLFVAWLDIVETRVRALLARRDMVRQIATSGRATSSLEGEGVGLEEEE